MSIKTYKQATWEAMKEEMLRDPSVYAMAEDIIGNGCQKAMNDYN